MASHLSGSSRHGLEEVFPSKETTLKLEKSCSFERTYTTTLKAGVDDEDDKVFLSACGCVCVLAKARHLQSRTVCYSADF